MVKRKAKPKKPNRGEEKPSLLRRRLGHMKCGRVWSPREERPKECPGCHRFLDYERDIEAGILVEYSDGR